MHRKIEREERQIEYKDGTETEHEQKEREHKQRERDAEDLLGLEEQLGNKHKALYFSRILCLL